MDITLEGPMDYATVLEDLEARLRAGQAQYEAWEQERNELAAAIEAVRKVAAREQNRQQIPLALTGAGQDAGGLHTAISHYTFRGLTYKEATKKAFDLVGSPLSAPDVANILHKAGYAKDRRKIKSNIDGIFKRLREEGTIKKVGDTPTYTLAETNGNGAHPAFLP